MSNQYTDKLWAALGDADLAAEQVRTYLTRFDGRHFDTYGLTETHPNRITAADLVAVTCLSMEISRSTKSGFTPEIAVALEMRSPQISRLLEAIPNDVNLHELDEPGFERYLGPGSAADRLFDFVKFQVVEQQLVGRRIARSKLLARKRPRLIPIRDRVVEQQLWAGEAWWRPWWLALTGDPAIVQWLENVRKAVGDAAAHLSVLRVADIIIWSRFH